MFDKMTFGERLRYIRRRRKMSQDNLAAQVGVSREAIYKYEHDMADPRLLIFVCIADALGVTMDFLVRGDLSEI